MRALAIILLAACASTNSVERGGPRGMRATEHLAAAERHDASAREANSWPVTTTMTPGTGVPMPTPMPWYRTWDSAADHEQRAKEHRSEAAALQAAFDEACRDIALDGIRTSPIARHGAGAWPTVTGAIVYLDPTAGAPDRVMANLRCHRAWMMIAVDRDMDACPLDLPGLVVDARGDVNGITLVLSMRDHKLVAELQRRVALQLETSTTHEHRGMK